jgi:CubicO group peptidase (beta-lactamase class C family)
VYSNAGFAIAGAMLEGPGTAWETLIERELWAPLSISTGGFGAPGARGTVDQPRGHTADGKPVEPGPAGDNPAAIGPAGTVRMSIGDWAKYVALHVEGEGIAPRLLSSATFRRLHAPLAGDEASYAMGWLVTERPWGGRVLTHSGSNTLWFCVTWLSPSKEFAVLVTCNRGGDDAAKGCDEGAWALIQDHLAHEGAPK